jgi:hypothetical protein
VTRCRAACGVMTGPTTEPRHENWTNFDRVFVLEELTGNDWTLSGAESGSCSGESSPNLSKHAIGRWPFEIRWPRFEARTHGRPGVTEPRRPDLDQSPVLPARAQQLFEPRGSINSPWPAWGSLSWHFDILDILVSLRKHLPLISIIDSSS